MAPIPAGRGVRVARRSLLVFLAGLTCLAVPAVADTFSYPKPQDPAIRVPGRIAGIRIGERLDAARNAWGSGRGNCRFRDTGITVCTYGNDRDRGRGVAYYAAEGSIPSGRVYTVTIAVGMRLGVVPVYKGPLMRIRTRHGIGLGSTSRRLRRAFPRLRRNSTGFYIRHGKVEMDFDTFNSANGNRVTSIESFRLGNFG